MSTIQQMPALIFIVFGMIGMTAADSLAQTTVILPDTSQTTGVIVNVLEQATVTIPATTLFSVSNISMPTTSTAMTVSVGTLARKTTSTGVALSLRANGPAFTPPQPGAPSWTAADVSWTAGTWSGGTGSAGILSGSAFTPIATCGTDGCSTGNLVFTLSPKPSVTRSGAHTLVVTWKIESLQ